MYKKNIEIFIIIFFSIFSSFFIYKNFVTSDSIRYAKGIIEISSDFELIKNCFNSEMSFAYYIFIKWIYNFFKELIYIDYFINIVNFLCSVLLSFIIFYLIYIMENNKKIALFSVIFAMSAPIMFMISHYGHPVIISTIFYLISLIFIIKSLTFNNSLIKCFFWFLTIIFIILSLTFRFDIFLAFGGYFGLLFYLNKFTKRNIFLILLLLLSSIILYFIIRYQILGYYINFHESTFFNHFSKRLHINLLLKNTIKNTFVWILSINPLIFIISLFTFFNINKHKKVIIFTLLLIFPYFSFFPFYGMDIARLLIITVIPFSFLTSIFLINHIKNNHIIYLFIFLVFSQIFAELLYIPVNSIYSFKTIYNNRVIAAFPLGSIIVDFNFRNNYLIKHIETASYIAENKTDNVLIIDNNIYYYNYYIKKLRDFNNRTEIINIDGTVIEKLFCNNNFFYFLDLNNNFNVLTPLKKTLNSTELNIDKVHLGFFTKEYNITPLNIYLSKNEINNLLKNEEKTMKERQNII